MPASMPTAFQHYSGHTMVPNVIFCFNAAQTFHRNVRAQNEFVYKKADLNLAEPTLTTSTPFHKLGAQIPSAEMTFFFLYIVCLNKKPKNNCHS